MPATSLKNKNTNFAATACAANSYWVSTSSNWRTSPTAAASTACAAGLTRLII